MSIVPNRYYNDPNIGAIFGSIAQMFAPPSAQDMAAYASAEAQRAQAQAKTAEAQATSAEAARLAEYYAAAGGDFDRQGVALGRFNPSQSYHAVGVNDATNRRGQDLESADRRFVADRVFDASTQNNVRDNERALATNAADNSRQITTTMLDPVGQGETRFVPPAIAELFAVEPKQVGQTAPLSETQWQAAQNERLLGAGLLTDQNLADAIFGEKAPVQIMGSEGPQYATPGRAAREGLIPYNAPSNANVQTENYMLPNGTGGGTAVFDPTLGNWRDAATREPLPQGSRTYTGQLRGGSGDTGFGVTNSNLSEATRLESSLDAAQALVGNVRTVLAENPNVAGVPGRLKGAVQSLTSSAQQVARAYAQEAPDIAISLDEARQLVSPSLQGYDPNIQRVASAVYDLAYMRAQIGNPGGEVSRQAFERALESFGQTYLSSQQDLATALDAFETDTIGVNRVRVNSLRGQRSALSNVAASTSPGASSAASPSPPSGSGERWERGEDGRLRRAQ